MIDGVMDPLNWGIALKTWITISPEAAIVHPLYGVKNWLAVFAFGVLIGPMYSIRDIGAAAQAAGVSGGALLSLDLPVARFAGIGLGWEVLCTAVVLWLLLTKHRQFRPLTIALLLSEWPVLALIGVANEFDGVGAGLASAAFPWVVSCAVWITYLQRSKRVRVTFEHRIVSDGMEPFTIKQGAAELARSPGQTATVPSVASRTGISASTTESARSSLIAAVASPSSLLALVAVAAIVSILWFSQFRPNSTKHEVPASAVAETAKLAAVALRQLTPEQLNGAFAEPVYVAPIRQTGRTMEEIMDELTGTREERKLRKAAQAEDDAKNVASYIAAATRGDVEAQSQLSRIYSTGSGVAIDGKQGLQWQWKAAAQGHARSQYELGNDYEHGNLVEQDYVRARAWYEKAAAQGDTDAQNRLSRLYVDGNGVPQSYEQAMYWSLKAAEQGDSDAQYLVARWYAKGMGTPQNYQQAMSWALKAAEQEDKNAQYVVGEMYAKGQGVKADKIEAHKWFNLAAAAGLDRAPAARTNLERTMTSEQVSEAQRRASVWSASKK